jgi:hypothetical protein
VYRDIVSSDGLLCADVEGELLERVCVGYPLYLRTSSALSGQVVSQLSHCILDHGGKHTARGML